MDFDKGKDLYEILGCDELATREQIITEYRIKIREVHPDKKPDDVEAKEKYEELRYAYDILNDAEQRKSYDTWRRSGLAVPFNVWRSLNKTAHTSQHWALRPKKEKMITSGSSLKEESSNTEEVEHGLSSVLSQVQSSEQEIHDSRNMTNKRKLDPKSGFRSQFAAPGFTKSRNKFRKYEI